MKRFLLVLLVALVAFGTQAAYATWVPGAAGNGASTSRAVGLPQSTLAMGTGTTSIHISWAAPGGTSVTPTQYVVRRVAPTTATVCTVGGATFACDDTALIAGTAYSYTVESRVGTNWRSGQSSTFSASTFPMPTFQVAVPPSGLIAGSPFSVVITATTNGTTLDPTYAGPKTLTYSGPGNAPNGATPAYASPVTFVAGVGTALVTLVLAETVSLQVTEGTRAGSATVTVAAGAATRLGYSTSTPDCSSGSVVVGNSGSFTSRVSVLDTYGNAVTGARTISLSRVPGTTGTLAPATLTVPAGASETSGSFIYTLPVGNPPDVTVTASSGSLTAAQCVVMKNGH